MGVPFGQKVTQPRKKGQSNFQTKNLKDRTKWNRNMGGRSFNITSSAFVDTLQYSVHCTSLHFTPVVQCTLYITALYSCSTLYPVHYCTVHLKYSVHCTLLHSLNSLYSCSTLYTVHHCTVLLQYNVHRTSLDCTPAVLCTQYTTTLHCTALYTYSATDNSGRGEQPKHGLHPGETQRFAYLQEPRGEN